MEKKVQHVVTPILFFCLIGFVLQSCVSKEKKNDENPWKKVEKIKAQIQPPTFPDRSFNITDFGAEPGGEVKNTEAFARAIQETHDSGGGKVVVPKGTFLTGAIHLESNVNLHLEEGATILFSRDPRITCRWSLAVGRAWS